MSKKVTAIFGVTPNPSRYAYIATERLVQHGHPVVPLGFRKGTVAGETIVTDWPETIENLDIITLYVGPARQPEFYDYLLSLKPRKIIFNPGTENPEFIKLCHQAGIETEQACTLVLLSTGQYH